ncbi:phage portal protein [Azospirillum sp. SYSU D00513]|uniref:phage portal protein n=1 Tax=Azospirillum sp. SYSU D00513 TaxID=2812561 RepID=UPI001A9630D4|nr:phage portal protein [Azospirillum sp. SYSU D00513]
MGKRKLERLLAEAEQRITALETMQAQDDGQASSVPSNQALLDAMRVEPGSASVTIEQALNNPAVFRCVDLVSGSIGMLPTYVMRKIGGKIEKAEDHPLFDLLMYQPNSWQTPYEFKQVMQFWALVYGNAYAVIVWTGNRVAHLIPIHPSKVVVEQAPDWTVTYKVTRPNGTTVPLPAREVLHLRGMSADGLTGVSRVKKAAETISISLQAGRAAERIFRNGMMVGGNLKHPGKLGPEGKKFLRESLEEIHSGPENAGKWIITEEGMEAKPFANTAKDSQLLEMRAGLVEEIARVFGVPRPLMGVDDTSWGSGIEQLAILFVRFGLAPWFKAWEEALTRSCLPLSDRGVIYFDFDETELLRGTLKDQAEFFARALGSGGHRPWMEANEVREATGLGQHQDGGGLVSAGEKSNVAPQAA